MAPIRPARLAAWRGATIGVYRLAGSDCAFQRFLFAPAGETGDGSPRAAPQELHRPLVFALPGVTDCAKKLAAAKAAKFREEGVGSGYV